MEVLAILLFATVAVAAVVTVVAVAVTVDEIEEHVPDVELADLARRSFVLRRRALRRRDDI
jgi:hypothetical protein